MDILNILLILYNAGYNFVCSGGSKCQQLGVKNSKNFSPQSLL